MKIVLDTNVFVAAFATHGVCEAIMELCLDQHELGVCLELLSEVKRNLVKKLKIPESELKKGIKWKTKKELTEMVEKYYTENVEKMCQQVKDDLQKELSRFPAVTPCSSVQIRAQQPRKRARTRK